jgi:hypothetical protein
VTLVLFSSGNDFGFDSVLLWRILEVILLAKRIERQKHHKIRMPKRTNCVLEVGTGEVNIRNCDDCAEARPDKEELFLEEERVGRSMAHGEGVGWEIRLWTVDGMWKV